MSEATRPAFDVPVRQGPVAEAMGEALAHRQKRREDGREQRLSFREWALKSPTAKGPLDFERFPFQPEIYDTFGDLNVQEAESMKGTQVGMSELFVRWTIWVADVLGLTSLYVFPAVKQMYDFSDTRVKAVIEQSAYLQSRILSGYVQNKGLRKFGFQNGHVYYRGSESKRDLIAVDADALALDEYDVLVPQNIPEAERRVSGSLYALIRRIGVPSDPEYGIARRYNSSDKRTWQVKCKRCREGWQPLTWFANIVWDESDGEPENVTVVCRRCKKPLDVGSGQWVAEHPDRTRPGFHVWRALVPNSDMRPLVRASKLRDPTLRKSFFNNDLGLPYADSETGLDRAAIAAAISAAESYYGHPLLMEPAYRGTNFVTAGLDVASVRALNMRISEHIDPLTQPGHRKRALWVGEVNSFDDAATLLDRYNVHVCCVDHLPEGRLARGLAERFPGRVYVTRYSTQVDDPIRLNTAERTVSVQRTPAIDATVAVVRAMRNLLPEDLPDDYADHLVSMRRQIEKDEYDRMTVTWKNDEPADFMHSEVYDLIATEVLKIRLELGELTKEEITTLDQRMEFERSRLREPYDEDPDYRPGPGDRYGAGPGDPYNR